MMIASATCGLFAASSMDPDVFWHLKAGEWILANRAIPRTDIYSWSAYGRSWTDHEWFWQVLTGSVFKHAGLIGLWAVVFVAGAAIGLTIRKALTGTGANEDLATLAGALSVVMLLDWLKPWPQAGVYILFAAYLYLSLKRDWGWRDVLCVALLGILWGNIHASAILLPLLLLAEFAWYLLFEKRFDRWRLAAAVVSAMAILANPYGVGIWAYALRECSTGLYRASIAEWAPYVFNPSYLVLVFCVSVITLFVAVRQGKEITLEFARAAGFWVIALLSRIYTPYAVMSTMVLLGLLAIKTEAGMIKRIAVGFLVFAICLALVYPPSLDLTKLAEQDYPVQAVQFIQQHGDTKVYNDYGWGGYLIYCGIPVYIDGRADMYGDIIKDNFEILQQDGPVGQSIADTGAETVLTQTDGKFDVALKESPEWIKVYKDKIATVYKRK
jgi:hypothetical protein